MIYSKNREKIEKKSKKNPRKLSKNPPNFAISPNRINIMRINKKRINWMLYNNHVLRYEEFIFLSDFSK